MIGKMILHYRIIKELGRGGMGVVYKAEDTKLGRTVAIKFLPQHVAAHQEERERFKIEARAAASLSHPNIATIYAIEESDNALFIVMEYIEGQELKEIIGAYPDKTSSIDEALDIVTQIAAGLHAAHQKGIVHRDIKAANIMITNDGKVKLMDFGLAKVSDVTAMTKEGTTLGTVSYMSPEQARGDEIDHRTDIWAFGVVLYEMLTGNKPFKGDYEQAVIYSIMNEKPSPIKKIIPDLPSELDHILDKALQKDRAFRYQYTAEILEDLENFRKSRRGEALSAPNILRLLRSFRKPSRAIPLFIMLIIFVLGSLWFFKRQAKIRWAKEEALPKIEQMVENSWRDYTDAYELARETEKYIPDNPKLQKLLSMSSLYVNVKTEPSGAKVYMKEYSKPQSEWKYLGVTPLDSQQVPMGIFRWKMEQEGYETVSAAAPTWELSIAGKNPVMANNIIRVLEKIDSFPDEMVRVLGKETPQGKLGDFYIDKYEVSNRKFKEFIESGGYNNQTYWKHKFIRDNKVLSWEEAMAAFIDQTGRPGPSTWQAGDYPEGKDEFPVSGVSWYEAAAYAEYAGKVLPTEQHWGIARGEYTPLIQWPQLGGYAVFAPFSNFTGEGPVGVGSLPGITSYGAYDMAGNVREWCWNETPKGRLIRGGAWDDNTYAFTHLSQAPPFDRSSRNGFRCALYINPEEVPDWALSVVKFAKQPDFYQHQPVSDEVFEVYKTQFSYDKTDLNARVESRDEDVQDWVHERLTYDAAYGNERVIAHLFLPKSTSPPFQTVIYFPGSASLFQTSSDDLTNYYEFPVFLSFLVKNGRAVLYPVYKGTFERRADSFIPIHGGDDSHRYTEYLIQLVKDFKRSIDFLESREDINSRKFAYYGMSWGGMLGAIIPAVEERLKVSILVPGALTGRGRPEANQLNYLSRVKIPTLMLNGRYDTIFPYETSIKPMFDLLGTPDEDKELKLYETDHIPPKNEMIKETLAWLDRYLGPVK